VSGARIDKKGSIYQVSHRDELQHVIDRAMSDPRVDAVIVPIGKGELVCRKV
jgi:predicted O-methyltransferase YrrM